MARHSSTLVAGALTLCLAADASAQQAGSSGEDTRTQYPAFLTNSFFSMNVGYIRYGFSNQQLEPGYRAESIETPHLAVRVGLFGHQFSKWLSAQATYTRPARFVAYRNLNGVVMRRQTREGFGGVTFIPQLPLSSHLTLYGEGGVGITSRAGFDIDGVTVVRDALFASALAGAGVEYQVKSTVGVVAGATYSPGRRGFSQPPTRLYTLGIRYTMRPLPEPQVEDNRNAGFIFPENVIRFGYTPNTLAYGPNRFFSRTVPIFWDGDVETRRGITLDYQHNVFHTKKKFALDLGTSASYWTSHGRREGFRTLSVYPLLRYTLGRTRRADVYVNYSLAGPSNISRRVIDGRDTGLRFTFQDFMGLGVFLGKNRSTNVEIGIKHYSNGNMFPKNAAIKIPLTLSIGHTFSHRKARDAGRTAEAITP